MFWLLMPTISMYALRAAFTNFDIKSNYAEFFSSLVFLQFITDLIGMYEFKPSDKLIQMLGTIMCDEETLLQPICKNIVFLCAGFSKELNTVIICMCIQCNHYTCTIVFDLT